ncbi:MAG: chemotaxis protein CheA [Candidatus Dadabacteria bacterium]|nr:MAG: chemotaxis protein CheA [Candidatus Dadabacteria bacterium]
MSDSISDKIEEIALLVVMLFPGDAQTLDLVMDSLAELKKACESDQENQRLVEACNYILEQRESLDDENLIAALNEFATAAQAFTQDNTAGVFPHEKQESPWKSDLSPEADEGLIIEFIEKHSTLMDDFEAAIVQIAQLNEEERTSERLEEFRGYVKSYLHNVKGDAGSVGLSGIEKVTHFIEDILQDTAAEQIIDQLLEYREWVLNVLSAYSGGAVPEKLSDDFIAGLSVESGENLKTGEGTEVEEPQSAESEAELEPYQLDGDPEILVEFIAEAKDHLNEVEELLLSDSDSYGREDLDAMFRAVHSIKGGSSYFNIQEITRTSHATENLMDNARNGNVVFNNALKGIMLDYIAIQRSLLEKTSNAIAGDGMITPSPEAERFLATIDDYLKSLALIEELSLQADLAQMEQENKGPAEKPEEAENKTAPENPAKQPIEEQTPSTQIAPKTAAPAPKKARTSKEKVELKSFVKVETRRLDRLMEYIGEMVISSSMLIRKCRDQLSHDEAVINNTHQLERISREIQEIGMSMRLVPIKGLFQKMSRVVWDTAKKIGKEVHFEMSGEDTELDRTVVEKLADPLMHMVRNAVDHGIETPEDRKAAGKPPKGHVHLSATHGGGSIIIEIRDDGKGLDPEKLLKTAVDKGIVAPGESLSEEEIYMLIFAPGFSTAKVVTDVSGRGVGMDVVRRNIEDMRGRINITSELGKGSCFTIELPLTLAIMEGIETTVGYERFIIPTLSITEFLRPEPEMLSTTLKRGEVLQYRDMFLPIFRLADLFQIPEAYNDPLDATMVIVDTGREMAALQVDDVLGNVSAVIKSLGVMFKQTEGLAGCSILSDGSIGLIVDVSSLLAAAKKKQRNVAREEQLEEHPAGAESMGRIH